MSRTRTVRVRVVECDIECGACGSTATAETDMAGLFMAAHHQPRIVALHVDVNGQCSVWQLRR